MRRWSHFTAALFAFACSLLSLVSEAYFNGSDITPTMFQFQTMTTKRRRDDDSDSEDERNFKVRT